MSDARLGAIVMTALFLVIPVVVLIQISGVLDGPIRVEQERTAALDRELAPIVAAEAAKDAAALDMLVKAQNRGAALSESDVDYAFAVTHQPAWATH